MAAVTRVRLRLLVSCVLACLAIAFLPLEAWGMTGYVATCSSDYDAGTCYRTIDGTGSPWASAGNVPQWIRVNATDSAPFAVASYTITPRGSIDWPQSPKDWVWQGSNDGTNWTTLDTRTAVTSWGSASVPQTFTVASSAAYVYHRIYVTAINGSSVVALNDLSWTLAAPPTTTTTTTTAPATTTTATTSTVTTTITATSGPVGPITATLDSEQFGALGLCAGVVTLCLSFLTFFALKGIRS